MWLKKYCLVMCLCMFTLPVANAAEDEEHETISGEMTPDLSDIEEVAIDDQEIHDPLESLNRPVFFVNKSLDKLIIRPVAVTYRELFPDWGKDRIHGAVFNMYEPVRIGNAILQTDADLISKTVGRFLTNTILGFGGLIDIAAEADENLKPQTTDFGLTLKHYGIGKGPYLVLPLLGPSTMRDGVGVAADYFMDPFNSYLFHKDFKLVRNGVAGLDKRYNLLAVTDHLEATSLDEYSATRSMYLQKR